MATEKQLFYGVGCLTVRHAQWNNYTISINVISNAVLSLFSYINHLLFALSLEVGLSVCLSMNRLLILLLLIRTNFIFTDFLFIPHVVCLRTAFRMCMCLLTKRIHFKTHAYRTTGMVCHRTHMCVLKQHLFIAIQ